MKSKSIIIGIFSAAVFVALPVSLFASTYAYVNTSGDVQYVSADSSAQALLVSNLGYTSGVMLVSTTNTVATPTYPVYPITSSGVHTYAYVNSNGVVQYVNANSSAEAMLVSNLGYTSGVMQIS